MRMTLISDATSEFPDNTNVDFKVRLAEPLHLKAEERWQAALVSMSTQNRPNTPLDRLGLKQSDTLFVYGIRVAQRQVFQHGSPSHFRHSRSQGDGGRSVWRFHQQCDGTRILVSHFGLLHALPVLGIVAKQQEE